MFRDLKEKSVYPNMMFDYLNTANITECKLTPNILVEYYFEYI